MKKFLEEWDFVIFIALTTIIMCVWSGFYAYTITKNYIKEDQKIPYLETWPSDLGRKDIVDIVFIPNVDYETAIMTLSKKTHVFDRHGLFFIGDDYYEWVAWDSHRYTIAFLNLPGLPKGHLGLVLANKNDPVELLPWLEE